MNPKFFTTTRAFAFSADIVLALVLVIGVLLFLNTPTQPAQHLEERRVTDQFVDDTFVALDHTGYVANQIDVNGFSSVTLQNVYSRATSLLPASYDLFLQLKSYPVDVNACRASQTFAECFPDENTTTLTIGTPLPSNAAFVHGRRIFIKQQPASQCSASLAPSHGDPFSIFKKGLEAQFADTATISVDVNVSPSGPLTCDQNITATLLVTSTTGARKPVDMMLVIDRSGSMSYETRVDTTDAQGLDLSSNVVYAADSTGGLRDINLSQPGYVNLIGTYNSPGTARDVSVNGNYAFLADGTSGLRIVNVTNPSSPSSVAQLLVGGDVYGVASNGNETYVVSYGTDVTDISNTGTGNSALYIGRNASQLYGAQSFQPTVAMISGVGVTIRDVGSPSGNVTVSVRSSISGGDLISTTIPSSSITGSYQTLTATFPSVLAVTPGSTYYLVLTTSATSSSNYYEWRGSNSGSYSGGQAYQNTTSQNWDARFETYFINGLIKVNTTTKNAPIVLGAYSLTDPWRISLNGTTAYVADGSSGMKIVDVSGNTPALIGVYNSPTNAYDVIASGSYAYVSDGTGGLRIVDISSPSSPTLTGTYNTPGTAYATRLYGSTAYVADGSSVQAIDVTNPASPSLIASYTTPWNYRDIEINYPWAYIAVDSSLEGISSLHLGNGPKINQLKVAAATFVDFNGWDAANDQLGMVSYASTASSPIDQTLTKTYSLVKSDINALVASGGTATGDGINAATTELNGANHNPTALKFQILMSDGQTNSGSSSNTAAIAAANSGIVIYTIGFGLDADATELTNIATITGGKYYAALDQNALIDVYSLIAQQIQLIATDANVVAAIPSGTLIINDGNGILAGGNLVFDINTQQPQPWTSTYTFNIPCTSQLACSSTLISIPSPGTEFQYIDVNGNPQSFDWNVFSTQTFTYRDLNVELTSGNILGTNNVDLTYHVNSAGNLDTNATAVGFYLGDPSLGNLLATSIIPSLCGQLVPGCVDYSYTGTQNVKAEGDLYAKVNPSGSIPECAYNDQDVLFCYSTPGTQFYTLDYWAWLHG